MKIRFASHSAAFGGFGLQSMTGLVQDGLKGKAAARTVEVNDAMTTLDERLYAWLAESDDKRFDVAFHSYYRLAYPAVIRRIARLSGWDPHQIEEIAQDALLKFFDRVGRVRREAAETVAALCTQLSAPDSGIQRYPEALDWSADIFQFAGAALHIAKELPPSDLSAHAATLLFLKRRGWKLVCAAESCPHGNATTLNDGDLQTRAETILRNLRAAGAEPAGRARHKDRALQFIEMVFSLIQAASHLRVPTNGLLFEIATRLYLDVYKSRGRQKRGGDGIACETATVSNEGVEPRQAFVSGSSDPHCHDPAKRYESEDFLQKFYEYLRAPVDAAHETLVVIRSTGAAGRAESRRLESLKARFSRVMSVLALIGQGYTQEEAAEYLRLSRNQIRYVVDTVQAAYGEFSSLSWKPMKPPRLSGVAHVL